MPITSNQSVSHRERQGNIAPVKLELLITIVDKAKADSYADLIQSYDVNIQLITLARGTAKADILNYLGLSESEKTVIFSVVRADRLDEIMYALEERFRSVKGGKGVSVSVPLTSVIGKSVYGFLSNDKRTIKQ